MAASFLIRSLEECIIALKIELKIIHVIMHSNATKNKTMH
jgi:hypothetical protein